jgi:hypothetical protein
MGCMVSGGNPRSYEAAPGVDVLFGIGLVICGPAALTAKGSIITGGVVMPGMLRPYGGK